MEVNRDTVYTIIGAVGAMMILFGFYRTSIGRWTNKSLWYELDNVVGAGLMIVYSSYYGAYVSMIINAVWIIVAFRGLLPFAERYGMHLRRPAKRRR